MKYKYICILLLAIFPALIQAQQVYTDPSGSFDDGSGYYLYPNNFDQGYLIAPDGASSVQLNFMDFDTEGGCDFVYVYDGSNESAELIGTYDNYNLPWGTITSTGPSLYIRFTTDGSAAGNGWTVEYTSDGGPVVYDVTYTDAAGTFDDGSGSAQYPNNFTGTYVIKPAGATRVRLNFTSFNTEANYDYVYVYNGENASAPLIGQYHNGNLPPAEITSSGNSLCLLFTTDVSVTYDGWTAQYTGITGGTQTTMTLNPDKDSRIAKWTEPGYENKVNTNYASDAILHAQAWTRNGYVMYGRSLLGLDLSSLPRGATIQSAVLYLYGNGEHGCTLINGSGYLSNECYLRRTTASWSETTVTWNTCPVTTTVNQATLPQSSTASQNYEVIITQLVRDMISNPGHGNGLFLILKNENTYARMSFYSSDYSVAAKRPKVILTYISGEEAYTLNLPVNTNYIHVISPQEAMQTIPVSATAATIDEEVQYFDGLGRPLQTVAVKASPSGRDLVRPFVYDQYGRETDKYLPFAAQEGNDGVLVSNPVTGTDGQQAFYNSLYAGEGSYARSHTVYEPSPLNRVLKQGAPGSPWQPAETLTRSSSEHITSYDYLTNTAGEVILWYVDTNGACQQNSTYEAGQLYVTRTTDENQNPVKEYKDKQDRIVLKSAFNGTNWLKTYYVYDDFGLLRFVLTPEAMADGSLTPGELSGLCYQYIYDERKRMTKKKLPGADWVYMVYDKRDRLVLTQDGNQRTPKKWLFTKYDQFNRPVITGIYTHGSVATVENMRALVDVMPLYETRDPAAYTSNHGYTNTMFPASGTVDIQTVVYYDDYTFGDFGTNASYDNSARYTTYHNSAYNNIKASLNTGMMTGKKVKAGTVWLGSVFFYDKFGRNIMTWKQNHLSGYDVVENQFLFTGQTEKSRHEHKTTYIPQALVLETCYYYDHAGRADYTTLQMSGYITKALKRSSDNDYDELGRVITKKLNSANGTSFTQQMDYSYNIRGWLTGINDPKNLGSSDYFGLSLCYNDITSINSLSDKTASFNGNISGTLWAGKYSTDSVRAGAYAYQYDGLNRIEKADYGDLSGSTVTDRASKYNVYNITYDKNGNIRSLTRDGATAVDDQLTYGYDPESNKLKYVNDTGNDANGFKELGGNNILEYSYDQAGNLTMDQNKLVTAISYNHLNLPTSVTKNGTTISYLYDAEGNKLNFTMGTSDKDYDGQFIYEGNVLKQILFDEGRIIVNGTTASYEYFMKDHLGNTRVSFDESGTLVQSLAYYPFGMTMTSDGNQNNLYRYNGKELQEGTDWYDYGARFYDPELGRWHSMDPLAEKMYDLTPYRYAQNNPIRITDIDGNDDFFDINGNFVKRVDNGSTNIIISNQQFSTVNFTGNLSAVSRIVTHYHGQVSNASQLRNGKITVYNALYKADKYSERYNSRDDSKTGAYQYSSMMTGASKNYFTNGDANEIRFNIERGKAAGIWDDYNNVKNALVHEDYHVKQGITRDEYKSNVGKYELDAYIAQFSNASFSETTSKFQKYMISNAMDYVNTGLVSGHYDYVKKLNSTLGDYGKVVYNYNNQKYEFQYK